MIYKPSFSLKIIFVIKKLVKLYKIISKNKAVYIFSINLVTRKSNRKHVPNTQLTNYDTT